MFTNLLPKKKKKGDETVNLTSNLLYSVTETKAAVLCK